jgi:uncharacterized Zn-finger protein
MKSKRNHEKSEHKNVNLEKKEQIPKHSCEVCKQQFTRIEDKFRHDRVEHGLAHYTCTICEPQRNFSRKFRLDEHMILKHETDDKPLSCSKDKCDKKFTVDYNLQRHLALHELEDKKPFVCLVCECRFEDQSRLETHSENHSRNHICNYCFKTFTSKAALKL